MMIDADCTANLMPERLSYIRRLLGMSQVEMAEKLDVTRQTLGLYENGKRLPDALFMQRFARITGCSLNYLYGLENEFGRLITHSTGRKIISGYRIEKTFDRLLSDVNFLQLLDLIDLAPHLTEYGYVDAYLSGMCHKLLNKILEKSVEKHCAETEVERDAPDPRC